MDQSERLVETYLKNRGFKKIVYEPDGNVPPDFLVDGKVAIEVRRLNQNHDDGQGRGVRGLEEVSIPLWMRFRSWLIGLGPAPLSGENWFVTYSFRRPIPAWPVLQKELENILKPFMASSEPQPFEKIICDGFRIVVSRTTSSKPTFFLPGGYTDHQSGGWLISELGINLNHCIAEKTVKIKKFQSKYPTWWLILADHIGYGLDEFDQELFFDQVHVSKGIFDRIVLLDPRDPGRAFDL
ncbi:MAG: hypothetical protein RIG67_23375 [Rhodospirillales bacterium]